MRETEIKHEQEVGKLKTLEGVLIDLIGKSDSQPLMDSFLAWQEQRNICNTVHSDWLAETLKNLSSK